MKNLILICGAAVIAVAATAALAAGSDVHEMTVRLPGGGVEHIQYTGDVAPKVSIRPFTSIGAFTPDFAFGFPDIAHIRADMDRQMRQMNDVLRQANAMAATPGAQNDLTNIAAGPPGSQSYSVVSISNGNSFCSRSVEVTSPGNGSKPKVVSHTSGDCSHAASDHPAVSHRNAI